MHKMINGDELRAFLVAAERGAINRAARELHLTQPAVTRRIQRLERALGVPLFDRRMRPPRLTRQGEIALREGQALVRAFARLRDVVNDAGAPSGDFRLGLAQPVAEMIAGSAIEQLRRQFPRLAIRLSAGWGREFVEPLRDGTLDFAVALLP
jgi:DNA-binding transcriptional LysR family regulator